MKFAREWLFNRVVITFALLAAIIIGWNLHVFAHDDGILEGVVIDANGRPVAGARVVLNERTITSLSPIAETLTGGDGRFRFAAHDRHALVLVADKPGVGMSERVEVRLYFRNQNRILKEPVMLLTSS